MTTAIELNERLIAIINAIQTNSGREIVPLTPDSVPLKHVPGFDSLNCVEATVEILNELDLGLPFNCVFIDGAAILSIQEASERLLECIAKKGAA